MKVIIDPLLASHYEFAIFPPLLLSVQFARAEWLNARAIASAMPPYAVICPPVQPRVNNPAGLIVSS